jgi:hypothetical protein
MQTVALDSSAKLITYVILVVAVVAVAGALGVQFYRRRQEQTRRRSSASVTDDGRLSRSSSASVNNPLTFGAGAMVASPTNRRETVAYGYLGVAEEYVSQESGVAWSVLSVTLPGWLPYLVVDHRTAIGRPGVPASAGQPMPTGDPTFDERFLVVAAEVAVVNRVLTAAVRDLLAQFPLQRVSLSGRTLLLRTFDDNKLTDTVSKGLDLAASELLSTAPSFVMEKRPTLGQVAASLPTTPDPLPQGFYGPPEQVV